MGYTHYWRGGFSEAEWDRMREIAGLVILRSSVSVAQEWDEPALPPVIDENEIRFNGIGDDGHETFCIEREGGNFNFCKTAMKPYDQIVVAILVAGQLVGKSFHWSSDGEGEDHIDGHRLLITALELERDAKEAAYAAASR